jgi:hypothetical protein
MIKDGLLSSVPVIGEVLGKLEEAKSGLKMGRYKLECPDCGFKTVMMVN